jgi:hypothetical protein
VDGVRERVRPRYAEAAGFTAITIMPTHQVAGGLHSAIIQATKPQHTEGR